MQVRKEHTAAFTGPRPENLRVSAEVLQWISSRLVTRIEKAISRGYKRFISGGSRGVDMIAAEAVLSAKTKYTDILLEIAVPHAGQEDRWDNEDKARYRRILELADIIKVLEDRYSDGVLLRRNDYMIAQSQLLIAVYDGISGRGTGYTFRQAQKNGLGVVQINPKDMTVSGHNMEGK